MERYESYKPTGIEWIGDIPSHWETASLRWLSKIYSGGTPDRNNSDYWTNGTIPWLNSGTVNDFVISEPSEFITQEAFDNSSAKWIEAGSIVIALAGQGKTKGMSAIVTFRTTCNQSLGVISPSGKIHSKYLLYFLTRNYSHIRGLAGEGIRDGLNLDVIGSLTVPFFDRKEQERIANYLDRKTEEIDKLIANKQKLIELLKEERTAIVNQAVTKGINSDVKFKPSGIGWLGDIPEHWEVKKLKQLLIKVVDNRGRTPPFGEDGIPMLEVRNITEGLTFPTNDFQKFVEPSVVAKFEREKVQKGDLLISTVGATAGRVVMVAEEPNYFIAQNVVGLRPSASINNLFLLHVLRSEYFYASLRMINKTNTIDNLKVSIFVNNQCVLPPLSEQTKIADYLASVSEETNRTISVVKQEIGLLQEYRTALISEVVTGKIKVG